MSGFIFALILWFMVHGLWANLSFAANAVCFKQQCFVIERADTPEKQRQGLMFRESMRKDDGMLFMFDEDAPYAF